MPFYSDDIKEEIRNRVDIVDVVGECVSLKRTGSNYTGLCPFHSEKTPSFSVAPAKHMFYCFGCHEGGDVFAFVQKYYNYSFSEAMEFLAEKAGMKLEASEPTGDQRKRREHKERLIEINTEAARFFHERMKTTPEGEKAYEYFTGRGLSKNTIIRFGLGYSPKGYNELVRYLKEKGFSDELIAESGLAVHYEKGGMKDKFTDRAMFPIFDMRGHVIGFGGRIMGEGEPKYLNSPDTEIFIKRDNLYAYNIARNSRTKRLILCEGYMDVITLHQAGFDYAVASLGTALTDGHVSLIKRLGCDVYVCYDSDRAGTNAAVKAIGLLGKAGLRTRVIHMDPAKDPDEYIKTFGADSFEERITGAENSFLFLMDMKSREYNMEDPTERTGFYNYLASEIYRVGGRLGWKSYVDAVCKKFGIEKDDLTAAISERARAGPISDTAGADTDFTEAGFEDFSALPEEKARDRASSGRRLIREKNKESGRKPQKKLLSWLAEEPDIYKYVSEVIAPTDFSGELYREIAKELFSQIENDSINIPKIVDGLPSEKRREAEECFSTVLEDTYRTDKGRALTELLVKIKELHIKALEEESDPGDMATQLRLMDERIQLQKFKQKGIRV